MEGGVGADLSAVTWGQGRGLAGLPFVLSGACAEGRTRGPLGPPLASAAAPDGCGGCARCFGTVRRCRVGWVGRLFCFFLFFRYLIGEVDWPLELRWMEGNLGNY